MKYGYARVNTEGQMFEGQEQELLRAGVDKIYKEKYTGSTIYRPVFEKLLKKLKPHDVLVVTKLDKFSRNAHEALEVMQVLSDRQIAVHVLNVGLIDETPTGKLILTVFSALAQFERDMIFARTQEGKKYARKHNPNYREGRKRVYSDRQIEDAYKWRVYGNTFREVSKRSGISVATLKRRFAMLHPNYKHSQT
ncbi:recombinase family protein [Lacticaseibacillus paracasei]|uniref:recombinase family protein n=1 Tax=Lacticaseibacillus paracasei TaxID=1597 RepID=UPI00272F79B7|nr:recombinase family protein [Lacticaseibacillus paracasei]MDP0528311.1 recombinase family protein [Lacticaseibacillus paracasei]